MEIEQQAKQVAKLKLGELRKKYLELVGTATKSNNRPYLVKKIVSAMQMRPASEASLGPGEPPESGAAKPNRKKGNRLRDPRLPAVGEVIEREHEGKAIRVKVLEEGFAFRNKTYRSLSAIAKEATGTTWNGYLFFGLATRNASGKKVQNP